MTPKRLLLFDIDGTLIDSGGAGVFALRDVLKEKWGITSELEGVEVAGKTDPSIVRQILRSQDLTESEENIATFLALYTEGLA
ncbi:MAG: HAD hydrolase-like protein, partial [Chthoniobacterales bacterium]